MLASISTTTQTMRAVSASRGLRKMSTMEIASNAPARHQRVRDDTGRKWSHQ